MKKIILITAFCLFAVVNSQAIEGLIYNDHNYNGTFDGTDSVVEGATIKVYDQTNTLIGAFKSNSLGVYNTGVVAGDVRLEVAAPEGLALYSTYYGTEASGLIKFAAGNGTGFNIGLFSPGRYCPVVKGGVPIGIPINRIGDQKTNEPAVVTFSENSGTNAIPAPISDYKNPGFNVESELQNVGTVNGLAYSSTLNSIFAAAFVKRHSGLGPTKNPTTIYKIDRNSGVSSEWVTIDPTRTDPHSGDTDTYTLADCPNCDPVRPLNGYFADFAAYDDALKEGLGDIEISADQKFLYAVDLKFRTLLKIEIRADGTAGSISQTSILDSMVDAVGTDKDQCPSQNDLRPYGLGMRDGEVFVGVVCTAQSTINEAVDLPITSPSAAGYGECLGTELTGPCSKKPGYVGRMTPKVVGSPRPGDRNKLRGYILKLDPTGTFFFNLLNFPLNYERGCQFDLGVCINERSANWAPWTDKYPYRADAENFFRDGGAYWSSLTIDLGVIYPSPYIADLAFDNDGSLIIGLGDRFMHQIGAFNAPSPYLDGTVEYGDATGDVLRACSRGRDSWVLEKGVSGDASCDSGGQTFMVNTEYKLGETQADIDSYPDKFLLSEYYFQDAPGSGGAISSRYTTDRSGFKEHVIGSVLQLPDRENVLVTQVDSAYGAINYIPGLIEFDQINWFNNGVSFMNNATGEWRSAYVLTHTFPIGIDYYSKGSGIGDLVPLCDPAPIEIGDRVWKDSLENGVQDVNDPGISGVGVNLYDDANNLIASTVTDKNGNYLFSTLKETSTDSRAYGLTLKSGSLYTIKLDRCADYTGSLSGLLPTTAKVSGGSTNGSPINDSDGLLVDKNLDPSCSNTVFTTIVAGNPGENDHSIDFGFIEEGTNQEEGDVDFLSLDSKGRQLRTLARSAIDYKANTCRSKYSKKSRAKDRSKANVLDDITWRTVYLQVKGASTSNKVANQSCAKINRSNAINTLNESYETQANFVKTIANSSCLTKAGKSKKSVKSRVKKFISDADKLKTNAQTYLATHINVNAFVCK